MPSSQGAIHSTRIVSRGQHFFNGRRRQRGGSSHTSKYLGREGFAPVVLKVEAGYASVLSGGVVIISIYVLRVCSGGPLAWRFKSATVQHCDVDVFRASDVDIRGDSLLGG